MSDFQRTYYTMKQRQGGEHLNVRDKLLDHRYTFVRAMSTTTTDVLESCSITEFSMGTLAMLCIGAHILQNIKKPGRTVDRASVLKYNKVYQLNTSVRNPH